jgi:hypothetical protein
VPLAPLVAGVRLSVTALSYDGQFAVSLLGDSNMVDMPVLAAGVRAAFEGYLKRAAGSWDDHQRLQSWLISSSTDSR